MFKVALLIFLIISFSNNLLAVNLINPPLPNDTINQVDESGKKTGFWIVKDESAHRVIGKGYYKNNKKHDVWTTYYKNGNKKSEINYIDGLAKGKAFFYYENGKLWESGNWQVNHWKGNYKFYHKNGTLSYDWNYDDKGKRSGEQKYYHENGQTKYEGNWVNGKTDGSLKVYNNEGILIEEKVYDKGKISARNKVPEKTIAKQRLELKEDIEKASSTFMGNGYHVIYDLNGRVDEKGTYSNGRLIDGERYIYNQGKLDSITTIKNGLKLNTKKVE